MSDYEIAVVGAGIAGLSAAMIARQIGHHTLAIDPLLGGGQLVNIDRVENYPGLGSVHGFEIGPQIVAAVMESGVEFEMTTVSELRPSEEGIALVLDNGRLVSASAVIVAAGSQVRFAGLEGEEEFRGRGVSYCAVCDGAFFAGKSVVVAGGGDSAADEAAHLATLAERVQLVHPGPSMHAMEVSRARVTAAANVEIISNSRVTRVLGGADGVRAVAIRREPDGAEQELPADGVFLYTGLEPNTAFLDGHVERDGGGHVITNELLETNMPGVFAAGDIRRGSARLLIAAAGDGATAAVSASRWLANRRG